LDNICIFIKHIKTYGITHSVYMFIMWHSSNVNWLLLVFR